MKLTITLTCAFLCFATAVTAETHYQGQFQASFSNTIQIHGQSFITEADVLTNTDDYLLGLTYFGPKLTFGKNNVFVLLGTEMDNAGQKAITTALWHSYSTTRWNFFQLAEHYTPIQGERQFILATQGKSTIGKESVQIGYRAECFGSNGKTAFVSVGPVFEHKGLRFWLAQDVFRADNGKRVLLRITKFF